MVKAVFLDRDGTLNKDRGYVHRVEDLELYKAVPSALRMLMEHNFKLFIISNQSGIGRGYFTIKDADRFNNALLRELKKYGIKIEELYYCPHAPEDKCRCRKPSPFFVKKAARKYKINLSESFIIGDHDTDIVLGKRTGMKSVLLLTGHGRRHLRKSLEAEPDFIAGNMGSAVKWIIKEEGKG